MARDITAKQFYDKLSSLLMFSPLGLPTPSFFFMVLIQKKKKINLNGKNFKWKEKMSEILNREEGALLWLKAPL